MSGLQSTFAVPPLVPGRPPLRFRRLSGVWRWRLVLVMGVGLALAVLLGALNIGRGDFTMPVLDVLSVFVGGGTRAQQFIVLEVRLPRTLTGALVGVALGISGAITQTVARNALASPDVLGVTDGASAAAVLLIVLSGGALAGSAVGLPLAALAGGLLTAALVYTLSWRRGVDGRGIDGYRLVLVGVGIGAVAEAFTSWLLVSANINEAARAMVWLTGSLNNRGWEHVVPVGAALAVLVPVALLLTFSLGALQLGDDTARGLGLRVDRSRTALLLCAVGLAAVATASAGPVGFIALVIPQVCQRLVGTARPPLLATGIYGAVLLLGADLVTRTVLPTELPVGIVTAVIGAPYLMWMLVRGHRGART